MKIIGITGGSGAGKSIVTDKWKSLGAIVIDADEVYHNLLKTNKQLLWNLEDEFPDAVIDGELSRKKLGEIVFPDAERLSKLNDITHPFIIGEVKRMISEAREKGVKTLVIEALYLLETDFGGMCDSVVAVTASTEKRMKRIISRDNIDRAYAWTRISSQESDDYYMQNSDILIENDAGLDKLNEKAEKVYMSLTKEC